MNSLSISVTELPYPHPGTQSPRFNSCLQVNHCVKSCRGQLSSSSYYWRFCPPWSQ
jgi:hypothetical protein